MRKVLICAVLSLGVMAVGAEPAPVSSRVSFNAGWRFARFGEQADGSKVAEPKGLEASAFLESFQCASGGQGQTL